MTATLLAPPAQALLVGVHQLLAESVHSRFERPHASAVPEKRRELCAELEREHLRDREAALVRALRLARDVPRAVGPLLQLFAELSLEDDEIALDLTHRRAQLLSERGDANRGAS